MGGGKHQQSGRALYQSSASLQPFANQSALARIDGLAQTPHRSVGSFFPFFQTLFLACVCVCVFVFVCSLELRLLRTAAKS